MPASLSPLPTLADVLVRTLLISDQCEDGAKIIKEMLRALVPEFIPISAVADVQGAILQREAMATTGIGNGIAIPHLRTDLVNRPTGVLAICRHPVEWNALDGEPVDLVFLLLTPRMLPGESMRVSPWAEDLHRRFRSSGFIEQLRTSVTSQQLRERFLLEPDFTD